MTYLSAEAIEQKNIAAMGESLGKPYSELRAEYFRVHLLWTEFEELFGKSEQQVDVLNRVAPVYFGMTQTWMWDALLLNIAKIFDSPIVSGKRNLTLRMLPPLIGDNELRIKVAAILSALKPMVAFCRDARNRNIAHLDLQTALDLHPEVLEKGSREKIGAIMNKMKEIFSQFEAHYFRADLGDPIEPLGGAAALVRALEKIKR